MKRRAGKGVGGRKRWDREIKGFGRARSEVAEIERKVKRGVGDTGEARRCSNVMG